MNLRNLWTARDPDGYEREARRAREHIARNARKARREARKARRSSFTYDKAGSYE